VSLTAPWGLSYTIRRSIRAGLQGIRHKSPRCSGGDRIFPRGSHQVLCVHEGDPPRRSRTM